MEYLKYIRLDESADGTHYDLTIQATGGGAGIRIEKGTQLNYVVQQLLGLTRSLNALDAKAIRENQSSKVVIEMTRSDDAMNEGLISDLKSINAYLEHNGKAVLVYNLTGANSTGKVIDKYSRIIKSVTPMLE